MRALVAAVLLLGASGSAFAQTLACNPKAPRTDPGAGFTAFGAAEQALARGGNAGPAWEWALGTDTEAGAKVQGSADWTSGRSFAWTLTHSGAGSASLVIRDGATTVLSLDYPTGMEAGNALELRATMNSSISSDTSIAANATMLKDKPASGALSLTGSNQAASQALYFYYPPMSQGFSAQGNVTLTYATLPTGSRVDFTVRAGTLPCTNQAPSVSLASPAPGTVLQAASAATLSATATDSDGTISKVEFFANSTSIGTATSAPYSIQWTPQAGNYTLAAVATDNAGDETTGSQVAVVANAQPTVSLTSPASGTVVQAPGNITLIATAADADGTVSKVDFYQGAALLGTATTAPYSFLVANLAAGTYSFTAVATDDQGGTATSAAVTVIANAPPTVAITSPVDNASFRAPANIALSATAGDADGTVASVSFYYGETLITTLTAAPYAFTWSGVPQGTYTLTARANDNYGGVISSAPVNITVTQAVGQLFFIEVDHLNTPRLVADTAAATVWRWDQQEPFGNNVPDENPSGLGTFELPLRLPGQYFDRETGLHQNWLRDYDANAGRYLQSDPIGLLGGLGTYNYVGARPLNASDPTGQCPWCIAGAIIGGGINLYVQLQQNNGNWNQVNWVSVGLSAATGAIGGGAGAFIYSRTTSVLANALLNGAVNSASSAAATAIQNAVCKDDQSVAASAALNFGLGVIGGAGSAQLANVATRAGRGAQSWINTSVTNTVNTLLPPKPGQIPFQYQGASVGTLITGAGGVTANVTGNFISNAGPLVAP